MENQDKNDVDIFREDWFQEGLPKEFILPKISSPMHSPWFSLPTSPNPISGSNSTASSSVKHQPQQDQVLNMGSSTTNTEPTLSCRDPVKVTADVSHNESPPSSPVKKKPCLNRDDGSYICMICQRRFSSVYALGGHSSSHARGSRKKDPSRLASFLKNDKRK